MGIVYLVYFLVYFCTFEIGKNIPSIIAKADENLESYGGYYYYSSQEYYSSQSEESEDGFSGYELEYEYDLVVSTKREQKGYLKSLVQGIWKPKGPIATSDYIHSAANTYGCFNRTVAIKGVAVDGKNAASSTTRTAAGKVNESENAAEDSRSKKMTFKELQELKKKQREDDKKQVEKIKIKPKFLLGPDCESLICKSCQAIVEEFGILILLEIYQNF